MITEKQMDKQNPFSLYDFLGYLLPGFFIISFFLTIQSIYNFEYLSEIINKLSKSDVTYLFLIIVASYIIGHFISYISSMSIERYSIWTIGYPSEYFFGDEIEFVNILKPKVNKKSKYFVRLLNVFILFPLFLPDLIFGQIFRFDRLIAKPLDSSLAYNVMGKVEAYYNRENIILNKKEDWFRTIYHYVVEKSERHFPKMQNYVALYGFNRAISMAMVIMYWVLLVIFISRDIHNMEAIIVLTIFSSLSYLFFCAFNKFYRKFCLEVLVAFLVIEPKIYPST